MLRTPLQHFHMCSPLPPTVICFTLPLSLSVSLSQSADGFDWSDAIVISWNIQCAFSSSGYQSDFISLFFPPLLYSSALSAHLCCPLLHAPLPAISAAFTRLFLHSFIFMCCSAPPAGAVLIRYKAAVFSFIYLYVCVKRWTRHAGLRVFVSLCVLMRITWQHLTECLFSSLFTLFFRKFYSTLWASRFCIIKMTQQWL